MLAITKPEDDAVPGNTDTEAGGKNDRLEARGHHDPTTLRGHPLAEAAAAAAAVRQLPSSSIQTREC